MKHVVSIGKKLYERKLLILGHLHKVYSNFKWEYPEIKIVFFYILFSPHQMVCLAGVKPLGMCMQNSSECNFINVCCTI